MVMMRTGLAYIHTDVSYLVNRTKIHFSIAQSSLIHLRTMYSNCIYKREMCPGEDVRTTAEKQLTVRTRHHSPCAWMGLRPAEMWEDSAVGGAGEMDIKTRCRLLCTHL